MTVGQPAAIVLSTYITTEYGRRFEHQVATVVDDDGNAFDEREFVVAPGVGPSPTREAWIASWGPLPCREASAVS